MAVQLVIQTAFLGDLILTVPFLKRLKILFPNDQVVLVCKKGLSQFLIDEQIIDQSFEVEKNNKQSYAEIIKKIQLLNVDNLFCIHRSMRSLLFTAQISARKKIGFSSFFGFIFLDETYKYETSWPDPIRKFRLLENLDNNSKAELSVKDFSKLNLPYKNGRLPKVPDSFSFKNENKVSHSEVKKIALFPGSVWPTKRWTLDGFTEVARYFINNGYEVVLLGGPDEKILSDRIAESIPGCINMTGQLSIADSLKTIESCSLVIANDSAATHMASFKSVPVLTLFGPTTLDLGFRPWSNHSIVVENNNLSCRPCGKHGHTACPLTHHKCMKEISSTQVIHATELLLNNSEVIANVESELYSE